MSRIFFDELGLKKPEFHLGIGSGSHGVQTAKIMEKIESILMDLSPEVVIVYGDTNSTLAGGLVAAKLHIPVVHIEAGLRSYNRSMPEEINRVITDHLSTLLCCPSTTAIENLKKERFRNILADGQLYSLDHLDLSEINENVSGNNPLVVNTGDIMYDAVLYISELAEQESHILDELHLTEKAYYLLTIHRAENTDDPNRFLKIMEFIKGLPGEMPLIFPMHPRTRQRYKRLISSFPRNMYIIEPVGYFDSLHLLKHSAMLLTDSGGMQKEAYWLKVPCVTLREETEWVETIETRWNVLYTNYVPPTNPTMEHPQLYGDGRAAFRIFKILAEILPLMNE